MEKIFSNKGFKIIVAILIILYTKSLQKPVTIINNSSFNELLKQDDIIVVI